MATIQVKNVPPEVHDTLRHRAIDAHQSLQEYVLNLLIEDARLPTLEEVLTRAGSHHGGRVTSAEVVAMIREDRDSR